MSNGVKLSVVNYLSPGDRPAGRLVLCRVPCTQLGFGFNASLRRATLPRPAAGPAEATLPVSLTAAE